MNEAGTIEYFSCEGEPYLILLPDLGHKYNVTVDPEDATCGTNGQTTWCNVYAVSINPVQYTCITKMSRRGNLQCIEGVP